MLEYSLIKLGKRMSLALVLLVGCASAPTDSAVQQSAAPVLRAIQISLDGDAANGESTIDLVGLQASVDSTFGMEDPRMGVLEFSGFVGSHFVVPMSPAGSLVDQVAVHYGDAQAGQDGPTVRVEFSLNAPADFSVDDASQLFTFHVVPLPEDLQDQTANADDSGASVEVASDVEDDAVEAVLPPMVLAAPAADATELSDLVVESFEGGLLVHFVADGSIRVTESFVVDNPQRLVVDLPGMMSAAPRSTVSVDSPLVSKVRIGKHADKIRIVFDGVEGANSFDGRWIVSTRDGLLVALGEGEEVNAALETATEPVYVQAEVSPVDAGEVEDVDLAAGDEAGVETELETVAVKEDSAEVADDGVSEIAHVSGVDFIADSSRDRIYIRSDRPIEVKTYEPDAETMIFRLSQAILDENVPIQISREDSGSISSLSAFQQPEMETPEARVVVKHNAGEKPQIMREGTNLWIDFAHYPQEAAVASPEDVASEASGQDSAADPATVTQEASDAAPAEDARATVDDDKASETEVAELESIPAADETAEVSTESPSADSTESAVPAAAKAMAAASSDVTPAEDGDVPAAMDTDQAGSNILEEGGFYQDKRYTGEHISLDFNDAEMSNIIRLIAEVSGLNVIAGDEIKGKITIRLRDVPWDQALDVVLMTKGLGFYRMGDILRIAPIEVLRQEEEARLQERRAKEKLEDLVVRLVPVNYTKVGNAKKLVSKILSARGSVMMDKRTNTLILKDIVSVLDESEALIKTIDTQTPQVMIEAKLIEANDDFRRALGARWNASKESETSLGHSDRTGGVRWTDNQPGESGDSLNDRTNKLSIVNGIADPTGVLSLGALVLGDHFNIDMEIEAAEENSKAKVISSPRVVTMDNQTATIEQGVSIPYKSQDANGSPTTEFIDATLSLEVTPHITADKSIIMDILVTKDAPLAETKDGTPISKNHLETQSLVKDGQTLVLGGIYQIDATSSGTRVPFFHSIPVFGNMFKSKTTRNERKELLVFISPTILNVEELASR